MRVFINLLGNAIENIPEGSIVKVQAKEMETVVHIEVEDDGLGIEPEFLPYMFDRYSPRSRRRQKLGSGLGLFICKTIVELHGGTIDVASEVGKGAVFSLQMLRNQAEPVKDARLELP
jgi:signal transduction histidine kinase